jgi:hypothetical protein
MTPKDRRNNVSVRSLREAVKLLGMVAVQDALWLASDNANAVSLQGARVACASVRAGCPPPNRMLVSAHFNRSFA